MLYNQRKSDHRLMYTTAYSGNEIIRAQSISLKKVLVHNAANRYELLHIEKIQWNLVITKHYYQHHLDLITEQGLKENSIIKALVNSIIKCMERASSVKTVSPWSPYNWYLAKMGERKSSYLVKYSVI